MCPIKDFLTFADRNDGFSDEVIGKQNDEITLKNKHEKDDKSISQIHFKPNDLDIKEGHSLFYSPSQSN